MGSCFSRPDLSIAQQIFDHGKGSNFSWVYYNGTTVWPYCHYNVVRNNNVDATDQGTNFDCCCSATRTALTLRKQGKDLIIAQFGSSGAVLGTRDENNVLKPMHLTVKLEPNPAPITSEQWKGPFISIRRITDADEFVVLATGGVWEVLKNWEVVNIVHGRASRLGAAKAIVNEAVERWRRRSPTLMVDDCAVVCLFLHPIPVPHLVTSNKINNNSLRKKNKKRRVKKDTPINNNSLMVESTLNHNTI